MQDERKIRSKSWTHHVFLRCLYQLTGSFYHSSKRQMPKAAMQPDNILCNKQLIALFLEDDKNIVFVFFRIKLKVAVGGVIHPLSPKN